MLAPGSVLLYQARCAQGTVGILGAIGALLDSLATVNLLRQRTPTMSSRWKRCCCHWVGLFHVFFWHRCFWMMMFASRIPETHQLIGFRHDPVCQAVHAALPHGVDVRRHFGNLAAGAVAELKTLHGHELEAKHCAIEMILASKPGWIMLRHAKTSS